MRIYKFLFAVLLLITIFKLNCYAVDSETITISTYYPSPYGSYRDMTVSGHLYLQKATTDSTFANGPQIEWRTNASGRHWNINQYDDARGTLLRFDTADINDANESERIIITEPGNVGIGTSTSTAPVAKLTVAGSSSMSFTGGGLGYPLLTVGAYGATPSDGIGIFSHDTTSGYVGWVGAIRTGTESGGWGAKTLRFQVPDGSGAVLNALNILGGAGKVGIGTLTPNQALEVTGRIRMSTWTADGITAVYKNGTGDIGIISSDARLKKNITPIPNALDIIENISGIKYNGINEENNKQKSLGVIAQQVMKVLPEATFSFKDDKGKEYFGVHYEKLAVVLIEAVKQQQKEIETQEKQIGEQKNSIKALSERVSALENDIKELKKKSR